MVWRSGQTYSEELRARVLAAVDSGGQVHQVAPLFEVSVSYIYKALARRKLTGVATALPKSGRPGRKLDRHLEAIVARLAERPHTTLAELVEWLKAERGERVCVATMWATLAVLGVQLKRRPAATPRRKARAAQPPAELGV